MLNFFFSKAGTRGILCKEQQTEGEQSEVMSHSVHGQPWALLTTWHCESYSSSEKPEKFTD